LDGTSNFTREIPLWGITIALVENGVPTIGAMYFPELNKFFYAELGNGATLNDLPIHVSKRAIIEALFYSRSYYKKQLYLDMKLGKAVGLVKIVDSSAYELSQIASGNAEIYAMVSVPHDVIAGVVLVTEAGGKITDFEGNSWNIKSKGIIVTNGVIHNEVIRLRDKSLYK
jgi:myo-inositol-1(or 4)-monophosphatase